MAEFGQGMIPFAGGGPGLASGRKGAADKARILARRANVVKGAWARFERIARPYLADQAGPEIPQALCEVRRESQRAAPVARRRDNPKRW
jgi:hypothetical protein